MAGNIPTEKVAQSMRQDVRLVGGVGNMLAGEEVDRSMVVDVGLDGSGDNMPAGEEVDQGVGHDVGLVGRDGNLLVRRMGQEDRVRDGEGDEGGNSPSVEMGDNRDSEFDDLVEKKEDPLGVEVDKEIVTNNVLNRLEEVDQTTCDHGRRWGNLGYVGPALTRSGGVVCGDGGGHQGQDVCSAAQARDGNGDRRGGPGLQDGDCACQV